jgi:peptidoglycan/xylan/chitin deacetylase (PgdA/CDA1 family)
MTRRRRIFIAIAIAVAALIAAAWFAWSSYDSFSPGADRIILLVPDGTSFSNPRVTVWLDAGSEEGLHVVPMHDSSFIRSVFPRPPCAGVILPDSVHQQASELFVEAIHDYVGTGGHLMLVYDAGVQTLQGYYAADRSRFSDLAGIDYALYKTLGSSTIQSGDVSGTIPVMGELGVPPGKYFPFLPAKNVTPGDPPAQEPQLRRYQYGSLPYPSFVTSGDYSGRVLLHSLAGVVAGEHAYQKGDVLFVNLPLGYLKLNTDGLMLHGFLKYFAAHTLSLPYMLAVPDGVGGLVLNWHVDSNAAIQSLQALESWTIAQQGPYSVDITAGPDTYAIGDGKGFDVLHNPVSQQLIRAHSQRGDEIGSHGGWIHNYFAAHVETDKPRDMEQYLELNKDALEKITGKPVIEYSAPNGDQPVWVTHWLDGHGFLAYYFTGDTGMAPTQDYRDGRRTGKNIWAFPIVQMDRAASFEELSAEDVPFAVIQQWLESLTAFVVDHQQVRLAYFHPPGILPYRDEVQNWMEITAQLKAKDEFRWYTMAQMANFLNARKQVRWRLTERDGLASLEASDSKTLAHLAWRFPADKFAKPSVVRGAATVRQFADGWVVVAGEGTQLEVQARAVTK